MINKGTARTVWVSFFLGLVVVVAISVPMSYWLKGKKDQTTCMSNLRRLGIAEFQYVRDYDETFPLAKSWRDELAPYTVGSIRAAKGETMPNCPSSAMTPYAMNKHVAGQIASDLPDPMSIPLHYDSTTRLNNYTDLGESAPSPPRHEKGIAVVFSDGHVRWVTKVDCSFKVVPSIHFGGVAYPLASLPSAAAPYDVNMLALIKTSSSKHPFGLYTSFADGELRIDTYHGDPAARAAAIRIIRQIFPEWERIRKLFPGLTGPYWVKLDATATRKKPERIDAAKL